MYNRPSESPNALRLHLNENTAGCSPAVLSAIQSITRTDTAFYPDYGRVTEAAERWLGVPAGWVQLTNGLDEGLHLVAQLGALRARPSAGHALFPEPAFEMYAACAEASGLDIVRIAPEPDFRFPLEAMVARVGPATRVIYLTDPNSPTGLAIPPGAIDEVAAAAPDSVVLVDEAYADFSGRTAIGPLLDRHRNLVVGRTFAKAHGLAALRAGALVAHPDALAPLRRIQPPFSLNVCAVRALEAALADRAYLEWYVAESAESRRIVYDLCDRHGLRYWPSEANFVLVRIGDAAPAIVEALAARGILIRDRTRAPGCAGCVRITTGVVADTRRCTDALEDMIATRPR
jgi:histidinol-phosphate aminotransferase